MVNSLGGGGGGGGGGGLFGSTTSNRTASAMSDPFPTPDSATVRLPAEVRVVVPRSCRRAPLAVQSSGFTRWWTGRLAATPPFGPVTLYRASDGRFGYAVQVVETRYVAAGRNAVHVAGPPGGP